MSSIIKQVKHKLALNQQWCWFVGLYITSLLAIGLTHGIIKLIINSLK